MLLDLHQTTFKLEDLSRSTSAIASPWKVSRPAVASFVLGQALWANHSEAAQVMPGLHGASTSLLEEEAVRASERCRLKPLQVCLCIVKVSGRA